MRRFNEPIHVRNPLAVDDGADVPALMQFMWRGKLWRVREVLSCWRGTGAWWSTADTTDLLTETDVWRVRAVVGRYGADGIYELAHSHDSWVLRNVVD